MNRPNFGHEAKLLLLLTALFWSSGGLLIKWVSSGPLMVAGTRSLIAAIVLSLLYRPKLYPFTSMQFLIALSYALTVLLFVIATKWTSAANAILLQSTAPIYVAIVGGIFLKEKIRGIDILTIAIVLIGMGFFFGDEISLEGFQGNLLGVGSGLSFAAFILLTRKESHTSPMNMIILGNYLAALIALPFAISAGLPDGRGWLGLLFLGIFQLALPYALYSKAIAHVPAIDTALIVLIEPMLNPLWVFLILGERPGFWSLIGGLIVLGAVAFRSVYVAKKPLS